MPRNTSSASAKSSPCFRMFARFLAWSHSNLIVTPTVATEKRFFADSLRGCVFSSCLCVPTRFGDGCHKERENSVDQKSRALGVHASAIDGHSVPKCHRRLRVVAVDCIVPEIRHSAW